MRTSQTRSWSVSFRRGSFWRRLIGKPPGEVEELAAYSTFAGIATPMATDPLVVRRESSAATSYKVTRTWLSSFVAGRGTISGIASTVRVCEHRHGHGQHHRRHNQSYRHNHKYALH